MTLFSKSFTYYSWGKTSNYPCFLKDDLYKNETAIVSRKIFLLKILLFTNIGEILLLLSILILLKLTIKRS